MSELIDREALLDECLNHYEVGNIEQNCTMDWICKTVRNFPAASPWHRVEDELPKLPDKDYCHVWCVGWFEGQTRSVPMEYGRILKRGKREERWLLYDRISLPPTKWAYLPEPPKEDT